MSETIISRADVLAHTMGVRKHPQLAEFYPVIPKKQVVINKFKEDERSLVKSAKSAHKSLKKNPVLFSEQRNKFIDVFANTPTKLNVTRIQVL